MPETALFSIAIATGLALLTYSADRFVAGASNLARNLGNSTMVIGLSIVAVRTSLPELATSVAGSIAARGPCCSRRSPPTRSGSITVLLDTLPQCPDAALEHERRIYFQGIK